MIYLCADELDVFIVMMEKQLFALDSRPLTAKQDSLWSPEIRDRKPLGSLLSIAAPRRAGKNIFLDRQTHLEGTGAREGRWRSKREGRAWLVLGSVLDLWV